MSVVFNIDLTINFVLVLVLFELCTQTFEEVFERCADGERVLVAINADANPFDAHFDAGCGRAVDLIDGTDHDFGGGSRLEPYSCHFWKCER